MKKLPKTREIDEIETTWCDWRLVEDAVSRRDACGVLFAIHELLIHTPALLYGPDESY